MYTVKWSEYPKSCSPSTFVRKGYPLYFPFGVLRKLGLYTTALTKKEPWGFGGLEKQEFD